MFAIAFDLVVAETQARHPVGATQAYADIRTTLERHGFEWKQGSLYTSHTEDLAQLFAAITALEKLPWFPHSVRDIRAFRVEQWSDFHAVDQDVIRQASAFAAFRTPAASSRTRLVTASTVPPVALPSASSEPFTRSTIAEPTTAASAPAWTIAAALSAVLTPKPTAIGRSVFAFSLAIAAPTASYEGAAVPVIPAIDT